ncbi:hypothetical protein B296_00048245 [Ensete ventricosum]|uniref:Uncharacterized protein n=1 Tax=Ensete ventricosum TaxID=4639 RepID=A0A426XL44_ENSVE|nr:hypothetical protein B296_00048245 [Ensete ventricosum]
MQGGGFLRQRCDAFNKEVDGGYAAMGLFWMAVTRSSEQAMPAVQGSTAVIQSRALSASRARRDGMVASTACKNQREEEEEAALERHEKSGSCDPSKKQKP